MKVVNIILILLFLFACNEVDRNTIHVGKNRQIKTIQSAVAIANGGDTVLVDAGLYKEGGITFKNQLF